MNLNVFQNLFVQSTVQEAEIGAEVESKRERIDFHRRQVRNGPVNFKGETAGQARRRAARQYASTLRKERKRRWSDFKDQQLGIAVLRGHLQAVGELPYADPKFEPSTQVGLASYDALFERYVLDDDLDDEYLDRALEHYNQLTGTPA